MKQTIQKYFAPLFIYTVLSMTLLMTVTSCAQLGLAPAQSFDEKLAYAYATESGIRTSAASALTANTITVTDAQKVLKVTDEARVGLDQARTFNVAGDTTTAVQKLTVATTILTQIQQFLLTKGVK